MVVRFILNGARVQVAEVDPHMTLLAWLRASGRTGSKEGCAEGECGACAVGLLQRDASGHAQLAPINSCLLPLAAADGQTLISVEGVAAPDGTLHPVQQAMVAQGGSQCGYCTPGFVVSMFCEYYRRGRTHYEPESIAGNLCRCTGYRPIVAATQSLPQPSANDRHLSMLSTPPPLLPALEHRSGERQYLRPTDLTQLFAYTARHPDAVFMAGGTDMMVYANQRYSRWQTIIALEALAELRGFAVLPNELVIGAGLPLSQLEPLLQQAGLTDNDALQQLWPLFSSRLIRNRATLGGNLATASPIGDSPPVLLALDAELTLRSRSGERRIPLADFFPGYRQTALSPGELIVSVHVPRPLARIQRFYKVSKRALDDISTVSAAFALDLDAEARVERLRIAYGGVAATPLRAHVVEQIAHGQPWTAATLARLLPEISQLGTPLTDQRGSGEYRRAMLPRLLEKFFDATTSQPEREAAE